MLTTQRAVDLNSTREVAIDREYKWNPDMTSAPRNCKLQLLGAGEPFWKKWAPLPSNLKFSMTIHRYIFRFAVVTLAGLLVSFLATAFVHPHVGAGIFVVTLLALTLLNTPRRS